ncbi:MAG: hypothetical protein ACLQKH_02995 [Steroidobacteraceae bacterium]
MARTGQLPRAYQAAQRALEQCSRVDECQKWANKAKALASYAKQAGDETLHRHADRIKARAIRRGGELAKQIPPAKNQHDAHARVGNGPSSRKAAANGAGLSTHQLKQAIHVGIGRLFHVDDPKNL